ncbi:MAG: histidine kinase, partial [Limisphaerales bacterium]
MNRWFRIPALALAWGFLPTGGAGLAAERLASHKTDPPLEIHALNVNGQPLALRPGEKLRLSSSPRDVTFGFGPVTNSPAAPLRIRYKLDGFEENWREASSDMTVSLRFMDAHLDPVGEKAFRAAGRAEGWTGALESSTFLHRREVIEVPHGASMFWLAISSAGPPTTVGIYAITNLVIARLGTNDQPSQVLLYWGADARGGLVGTEWVPTDWHRNGLRISMARVTAFGPHQEFKALMLLDNDPNAHAEWDSDREGAPVVKPGERLLFEWDETYSLGLGGYLQANYAELPAGFYRFRINELSLLGVPGEAEASLAFEVPAPFWHTLWFWGLVALLCLSAAGGTHRYVALQQTRKELARLESQHALEHERLRIARDIHDDLGARVTQIALVSGVAQADRALSDKARADFNSISSMAHELVSALYENVWA